MSKTKELNISHTVLGTGNILMKKKNREQVSGNFLGRMEAIYKHNEIAAVTLTMIIANYFSALALMISIYCFGSVNYLGFLAVLGGALVNGTIISNQVVKVRLITFWAAFIVNVLVIVLAFVGT